MTKNLVVCCDGTGNQIEGNLSNVLKLFRILHKNQNQRVYYNPGIGTIGTNDPWTILISEHKRRVRTRNGLWFGRRNTRRLRIFS